MDEDPTVCHQFLITYMLPRLTIIFVAHFWGNYCRLLHFPPGPHAHYVYDDPARASNSSTWVYLGFQGDDIPENEWMTQYPEGPHARSISLLQWALYEGGEAREINLCLFFSTEGLHQVQGCNSNKSVESGSGLSWEENLSTDNLGVKRVRTFGKDSLQCLLLINHN
jgi:hypothetical protein